MTKRRKFELTYEQQRTMPCECEHSLVSHEQRPDTVGRCVAADCACAAFQRKLMIPPAVPMPDDPDDPDDIPF